MESKENPSGGESVNLEMIVKLLENIHTLVKK